MAGKLKLDEFITHTMPLDKINEAFDLMHAGERFDELVVSYNRGTRRQFLKEALRDQSLNTEGGWG